MRLRKGPSLLVAHTGLAGRRYPGQLSGGQQTSFSPQPPFDNFTDLLRTDWAETAPHSPSEGSVEPGRARSVPNSGDKGWSWARTYSSAIRRRIRRSPGPSARPSKIVGSLAGFTPAT